jgi:hypothetical protein
MGSTWKDCEGPARKNVAARCAEYRFHNTLSAVADYWLDVVSSDHSQPDKYAQNVHGFLVCLGLASKQWNDTARTHWPTDNRVTLGHRTANSTAVAAMEYFHDVACVLFDGPMADAKAYGDTEVSREQLKHFKQSMVQHFSELGIPAKPGEVLGISDCIEHQIFIEADSARASQAKAASIRIEHLRQQFLVVGEDKKLLNEAMTEGGLILAPLIEIGAIPGYDAVQQLIDAARKPSQLSEFSYLSLFQIMAMWFSDRQRVVLHTVSSSNDVTLQKTRTEDTKQQAHRYASLCSELVAFIIKPEPVPVQPAVPVAAGNNNEPTGTTPADIEKLLLHKAVEEFAKQNLKYESNQQQLVEKMLSGVVVVEELKAMFFELDGKESKKFSDLWNTVSNKMQKAVGIRIDRGVNELRFVRNLTGT